MYTKISVERNFEIQRNFLFGSPDLLIERIVETSKGITLSDLRTTFINISRHYHRSIKRQYPVTIKHFHRPAYRMAGN